MIDSAPNTLEQFISLRDKSNAEHSQRFFKTGKGQYGEGDIFLGIRVPVIRQFAKQHKQLSLAEIEPILHSEYHEARLLAVIMLVNLAKKADEKTLKTIYQFYVENIRQINNWDIVDCSAPDVLGRYLFTGNRQVLYKLAKSKSLWEKRISIMATFYFIKQGDFTDTMQIAKILLNDPHDLIQKATGWMLREIGNRNIAAEENFLKNHYLEMPRTMLRYAIEKFSESKRQKYLHGKVI